MSAPGLCGLARFSNRSPTATALSQARQALERHAVTPDDILRARFGERFWLEGETPDRPRSLPDVLADTRITYTYEGVKGPALRLAPALRLRMAPSQNNPDGFVPPPYRSFAVFADTSKMATISFSLPAGPVDEGGTCPVPGLARPQREGHHYVCASCYALGGDYRHTSVQIAEAVRLIWVRNELAQGSLGEAMARAIEEHATRYNRGRFLQLVKGKSAEVYARKHGVVPPRTWMPADTLGVWDGRQLVAAGASGTEEGDPRIADPTAAIWRRLHGGDAPPGSLGGYVRVHDSGDFFSVPYLMAWVEVAQRLPHVRFWAPSRQWLLDDWRDAWLPQAAHLAPNLVIRPSALYTDTPAPAYGTFAAGSGVHADPGGEVAARRGDGWDWACPVYTRMVPDVTVRGGWREAKSCADARCRYCWEQPGGRVSYGFH